MKRGQALIVLEEVRERAAVDSLQIQLDALLEELSRWDGYVDEGPFLCGDQFTLADIAVFPLLMHFEAIGYDYAKHTPSLFKYMNQCKARPSVVQSGWIGNFNAFVRDRNPARVLAD